MKALFKKIREWKQGYIQYLKYRYHLTILLYFTRWKRIVNFFSKHSGIIRRIILVVTGLTSGLLANYFGVIALTKDVLSSYLITVAAMIGGTIAIIFSISIFLLQGVADLYSSKHFEEYTNNWRDQIVYIIVIVITLGLFGTGLYVAGISIVTDQISSYVVLLSLALIGLVFGLIDWQYELVRKKISPANAIVFLQNKGLGFLNNLQGNAERIAKVLKAQNSSLTQEMALATAYNRALQPFIKDLDRQLQTLVEISLKLADREEVETTKMGLNVVRFLLVKFFELRKTSSLVLPSPTAFLALESDSQRFLFDNFDRLNKAGEKFMKEGKDELATNIVDNYRVLAIAAKEIKHLSQRNENPIFGLVADCLNMHIANGIAAKNIEVIFQGSRALGDIAVMAADKGLETTLYGLQEKIMKTAIAGLGQKQNIIVDQCSLIFLKIIAAVFRSNNISRRHHFDNSLKNIATIASYLNTFIKSGIIPNDIASRFSLSKGYDEFYAVLVDVANHYGELTEEREKAAYRNDLIEFFREINLSLRTLSEEVKSCDTVLTDSVGRLLYNLNNLIVDLMGHKDFKDEKEELANRLSWNIHLPGWFVHYAKKFDAGSNPFNTLTDSVAKTGILIVEKLDDEKMVSKCIDCLASIANHSLEKGADKYGYDEPRAMEKACYLGIIALKKGWKEAVAELRVKLYDFEPKYVAKYFSNLPPDINPDNHNVIGLPHKDQLFRELLRWRDEYDRESRSGILRIRDDAEAMMYEIVEKIDIDRFMFEVWQKLPADSKINKRIKKIKPKTKKGKIQQNKTRVAKV